MTGLREILPERKTILVVEDDRDLRQVFRDALKYAGYDVVEAADGPEALEAIAEAPPALVILDIGLRTLDGLSVRDEIAADARTRDIPVIVVTGMQVDVDRLNATRVLRKPVHPELLLSVVRMTIGH